MLDRKELTLTLDDFRIIFHLPQANDNNHASFAQPPSFSDMTIFPEISRHARDAYHNLQDDDIMKHIFNLGRNKNKVRMRIPAWMITDEMKLTESYKMYAEHKSHEEQEARENVALVDEHLTAEEIEKLVENPKNVDDSSPPRHDDTSIPGTRLEPRSDKESPEVEIVQEKEEETTSMVDVTNIVIPINVDDEED
ncbi:hypothetical protein Tco_0069923 [Tanacetum coccineum]